MIFFDSCLACPQIRAEKPYAAIMSQKAFMTIFSCSVSFVAFKKQGCNFIGEIDFSTLPGKPEKPIIRPFHVNEIGLCMTCFLLTMKNSLNDFFQCKSVIHL